MLESVIISKYDVTISIAYRSRLHNQDCTVTLSVAIVTCSTRNNTKSDIVRNSYFKNGVSRQVRSFSVIPVQHVLPYRMASAGFRPVKSGIIGSSFNMLAGKSIHLLQWIDGPHQTCRTIGVHKGCGTPIIAGEGFGEVPPQIYIRPDAIRKIGIESEGGI